MSMQGDANTRVRWTPARIRRAMLLPKPRGAIAKAMQTATEVAPTTPDQVKALQHLAEHGDFIAAPVPEHHHNPNSGAPGWLLVPAPVWLLEALSTFGADAAELEPEPIEDNEDGGGDLDDSDREGYAVSCPVTEAQRRRYRERCGMPQSEVVGPLSVFASDD